MSEQPTKRVKRETAAQLGQTPQTQPEPSPETLQPQFTMGRSNPKIPKSSKARTTKPRRPLETPAQAPEMDVAEPPESSKCYTSEPVNINSLNAYTQFMKKCRIEPGQDSMEGSEIPLMDNELPLLRIGESESVNSGLKAPISIVKVRKAAWETLARSLEAVAQEPGPKIIGLPSGIYKTKGLNGKPAIRIVIQANLGGLGNLREDAIIPLCDLSTVFANAEEDEIEDKDNIVEEEEEEDDEEGKKSIKKGITRENLRDSNPKMKELDENIMRIISLLFLLYRGGGKAGEDAKRILFNFIVVSSEKEYLDTGQLYAICEPVINRNNENKYDNENILGRCEIYLSSEDNSSLPSELLDSDRFVARKPMLETIDGAATRIASNQYFTSYCNFKLKNNEEALDASFYIDNNDIFKLSIWFSQDQTVIDIMTAEITKLSSNIQNKINKYYEVIERTYDYPSIIIDICYCILSDEDLNILLNTMVNKLIGRGIRALMMNNEIYFMASTACFLFKYNNNPNIVENLLKCNFDSLCHDNGESKIYRLVMILIFILKNDVEEIKQNLCVMFPKYFIRGSCDWNQSIITEGVAKLVISKQKIYDNTSIYGKYVDFILKGLDDNQKNIFKVLSLYAAHDVESGLYRRLLKKSSYVFPVLHAPFMIIVNLVNSADAAFGPAQQVVQSNPGVFKLSALDQGAIIPHFTICAIDAPLKHGLSLSNYDISSLDSNVMVTAVTRNDAAAQNMSKAEEYTDPICMRINIDSFQTSSDESSLDWNMEYFTYKFIYGNTIKTIVKQTVCPPGLGALCNTYINIVKYLEKTRFYFKKRDNGPFRDEVSRVMEVLLQRLIEDAPNRGVSREQAEKFRKALSILFINAICGITTAKKPKCSDVKVTEDKMNDAKLQFLNFFIDYINSPESPESKAYLIEYTNKLFDFTKETRNLDNLISSANTYVPFIFGNQRGGRTKGGKVAIEQSISPRLGSSISTIPSYEIKSDSPTKLVQGQTKQSIQIQQIPSTGEGIKQKIITSPTKTVSINYILPDNLKLSYSSLFGNYGFSMDIDGDGEYELNILNTEEDYNRYLQRYSLNTTEQPNQPSGGKIKTRKSKFNKHRTRKIKKIRNRRQTHKRLNKLTKRKTRRY